jgi:hypothetical protein
MDNPISIPWLSSALPGHLVCQPIPTRCFEENGALECFASNCCRIYISVLARRRDSGGIAVQFSVGSIGPLLQTGGMSLVAEEAMTGDRPAPSTDSRHE